MVLPLGARDDDDDDDDDDEGRARRRLRLSRGVRPNQTEGSRTDRCWSTAAALGLAIEIGCKMEARQAAVEYKARRPWWNKRGRAKDARGGSSRGCQIILILNCVNSRQRTEWTTT